MNDSTRIQQQVNEFARAVRSHLGDLPDDEIAELTDGLEADLTERMEDGGELGDSRLYADELRAAAGYPAAGAGPQRRSLRDHWDRNVHSFRTAIDANPQARGVADFLVALTPAWWVARGMLVMAGLMLLLGRSLVFGNATPLTLIIGTLLVIVSVQWGRGRWMPGRIFELARTGATILAILAVIPSFSALMHAQTHGYPDDEPYSQAPDVLALGGERVTNIFAYDCEGNPVVDVQLFDQTGTPLAVAEPSASTLYSEDGSGYFYTLVPSPGASRLSGWNVFPLLSVDGTTGETPDPVTAQPVKPPFPVVRPLAGECPRNLGGPPPADAPDAPDSPAPETEEAPDTEPRADDVGDVSPAP